MAALALMAIAATPSEAQRLEGHVFDAATGEPIPTALVQLIAADSTVLAGTATDARSRFEFVLPGDAQFLRATRLGYGEVRAPLTALRAEGPALIVRLPPRAIPVPEVVVEAERRNRYLDGVGFYNRRRLGIGEFIGRDIIERNHANARSAGDILATLRGLMVRAGQEHDRLYMARAVLRIEGFCGARIYVNGAFHGEEVPHVRPDDIEAIEVYRGPADVPSQYGVETRYRARAYARWGPEMLPWTGRSCGASTATSRSAPRRAATSPASMWLKPGASRSTPAGTACAAG